MPTASSREFGFRFDLRTKGGQEAARVFGQMAASLNKLSSASVGTRAHMASIAKNMATLSAQTDLLSKKFDRLGKSISTSTNSNQTANIYRMAASLGAMGFVANRVGDGILRTFTNVGKSLFEVGTSFEYIKAGLDFAFGFRSQEMMTKAMNIAQETNISTREVLDVTRSLGVLKINPFSDMITKRGQIQSSLQSLADLAALVPQQGMEGALFAIRNAISGQWRSLQMRFDIPLNMIDEMRSKITATMGTQQRFDTIMQGITNHFGGMMKSVSHTTKFYVDNIKDVVTNLAYDVFTKAAQSTNPFFERVFNYFKNLRNDQAAIDRMSQSFIYFTKSVMGAATHLFNIAKTIVNIAQAHPTLVKMLATGTLMFGIFSKLVGTFSYIGSSLMFAGNAVGMFTKKIRYSKAETASFSRTWSGIKWTIGINAAILALTTLYGKVKELRGIVGKEDFDKYEGEALSGPGMATAASQGYSAATQAQGIANFPALTKNNIYTSNDIARGDQDRFNSNYAAFAENVKNTLANTRQDIPKEKWMQISSHLKGLGLYEYVSGTGDFKIPGTIDRSRVRALSEDLTDIASQAHGMSFMGRYQEEQKQEVQNFYQNYKPWFDAKTDMRAKSIGVALAEGKKNRPSYTDLGAISNLNTAAAVYNNTGNLDAAHIALRKTPLASLSREVIKEYAGSYQSGGKDIFPSAMYMKDKSVASTYDKAYDLFTNKYRLPGGSPAMLRLLQSAGVGKTPEGIPIPGQYAFNTEVGKTPAEREQWAAAKIKSLLTKDAQVINVDLPDDINRALLRIGAKMDDVADNTEDTADNTRRTEELLPPIFRRIFDDFTRRERRAEMGANALYGRLAMAR